MLSEKRLAEIKARYEAATPGEWSEYIIRGALRFYRERMGVVGAPCENDFTFISHARADVPDLVAEVDLRRAEIGKLRNLAETAWSIIANASGGDWSRENAEWNQAAARWRDDYHAMPESSARAEAPKDVSE